MSWSLRILGTNAAVPANGRFPSAQVLDTLHALFLIDCGEGTQMRLSDYHVKRSRIQRIFISHLHGDHFFGLPGLITSYGLFGRKDPLVIHGPYGIHDILVKVIEVTNINLNYDLIIEEHDSSAPAVIVEDQYLCVSTIPLKHRVPTTGYIFREKVMPRSINRDGVQKFEIPFQDFEDLQHGKDWKSPDGRIISNSLLTHPGRMPCSFAYCSDTAYFPEIIEHVKDVSVLYHESTFLDDLREKAERRGHATAMQAAEVAEKANAKLLILGHFSSRYQDVSVFEKEASRYFPNVIAAREGMTIELDQNL